MAQILVVDDSSTVREAVSTFFTSNGFEVITACDGVQGLKTLQSHPEVKLVISDVNMPNMDGLTMCERIRSELKRTSVHLIMLTTESNASMKERGKAAGVKGWVVKPFKGAAMLEAVKKLVS